MAHLRRLLAYSLCVALATPPYAYAQTPPVVSTMSAPQGLSGVTIAGSQTPTYGRLIINWPAGTKFVASAAVNSGIALIRLPRAIDVDPSIYTNAAPQFVAAAALSADKRTIRLALVQNVRLVQSQNGSSQAFDLVLPDAQNPAPLGTAPEPQPIRRDTQEAAAGPLAKLVNGEAPRGVPRVLVAAAVSKEFTRIRLTNAAQDGDLPAHGYARVGDRMAIAFPGTYALDSASMRAKPPARVRDAARYNSQTNTSLVMDVDPASVVRHSRDGRSIVIDILPPGTDPNSIQALQALAAANVGAPSATATARPAPPKPKAAAVVPGAQTLASGLATEAMETARADPAPSGLVEVTSSRQGSDAVLEFGFAAPAPAAMFRRGDSIYVLFATTAKFDVSKVKPGQANLGVVPVSGEGVSGVRVIAPPETVANPSALGGIWRVSLSPRKVVASRAINIEREVAADGTGRVKAIVPDSAATGRFVDPVVGDTILVGMALGPATPLATQRSFLEASLPETFHGLAVTLRAEDFDLRRHGEGFVLVRPTGMALSRIDAASKAAEFAPSAPGFVDYAAWRLGPSSDFSKNLNRLRRDAAIEVGDATAGVRKRLDLARFLMAWELGAEAAGVLRQLKTDNIAMARAPEVIGLEGAAQVQMGRGKQALDLLSQPEVANDAASQLWAGLGAQLDDNAQEARVRFERGNSAINSFAPQQRAVFLIASAQASLDLDDIATAASLARRAAEEAQEQFTKERAKLIAAIALAKLGKADDAMAGLTLLASSKNRETASKAAFEKIVIGINTGKTGLADAVRALDALRYAWRGDGFELELLRRLGGLYISGGDIRSGLTTMTAATTLRPDLPAARALRDELYKQFKYLFLDGGADGMPPVQALALFYDFKDLAPIGPEGDRMVRGLADRLVALDLLPQAAQLLQHQVDNRLEGFAKAQVATDLAAIYLMDRRAEPALQAIWSSRVTQLPEALNAQRRLIESAALAELGRDEHALEIIEFDNSPDASRLRAELYMRTAEWAKAAENARATLPLVKAVFEPEEAGEVLRTAVATSVAGDRAGLASLVERFGEPMSKSAYAEAFKVVTDPGVPNALELQKAVADLTGGSPYNGLMKRLRSRLTQIEAPTKNVASAGSLVQIPTDPTDSSIAPKLVQAPLVPDAPPAGVITAKSKQMPRRQNVRQSAPVASVSRGRNLTRIAKTAIPPARKVEAPRDPAPKAITAR